MIKHFLILFLLLITSPCFSNQLSGGFIIGGTIGSRETLPPYYSDIVEWWDNRSADITDTGGLVNTWTGRVNGNVFTGTTTTRPTKILVGGVNYIYFNGSYFDLTDTFTINRRNSCIFLVTVYAVTIDTYPLWHSGTSSNTHSIYWSGEQLNVYNGSIRTSGKYRGNEIATIYANASASGLDIGMSGESTTVTASDAGTIVDGYLGAWNGLTIKAAGIDILSVLVYNRTLLSAEVNTVLDYLTTKYKSRDRINTKYIVYEGDSLTYGSYSSNSRYKSYPSQIAQSQTSQTKYSIEGSPGEYIQGLASNSAERTITEFGYNTSATPRTVVLWIGTNDIVAHGRSTAQITADLATWISAVRAAISGVKIVGVTITKRAGCEGTMETIRQEVNTWILNTGDYDYKVDLASKTEFSDISNTTYFHTDGIHFNDTGYGVIANYIKAVLSANGLL